MKTGSTPSPRLSHVLRHLSLIGLFLTVLQTLAMGSNLTPLHWENVTGMEVSGNVITATAKNWGKAGANGDFAFIGDGELDFQVNITHKRSMVGLAEGPGDLNFKTINYALYFNGTGVSPYEKGRNRGSKTNFVAGDRFQIARVGDTVEYRKNGETFYTSEVSIPSFTPLMADISTRDIGASFSDAQYVGVEALSLVKLSSVTLTTPTSYRVEWPVFSTPSGNTSYSIYLGEELVLTTDLTVWDPALVPEVDANYTLIASSEGGDYLGKSVFFLPAEPNFDNDDHDDRWELETYGSTEVTHRQRPYIVNGIVENVTNVWQKVFYPEVNTSDDPTVVVCAPVYGPDHSPAVPMIRNVTNESFELCLVSASGEENVAPASVTYMATQGGQWRYPWEWHVHSLADTKPADQVSTFGDMISNNFGAWYPNPVVYGTVEVTSDAPAEFQSFYSHGVHPDLPAKAWNEFYGSHSGSDTSGRQPAEVHLIMFVEGTYLIGDQYLEISTTAPVVGGIDDGGAFLDLGKNVIDNAIISTAGIRSQELSFPVIMNQQLNTTLNGGLFHVAMDKDTLSNPERTGLNERAGLAIFSKTPSRPRWSGVRSDVVVLRSSGGKVNLVGLEGTLVQYEMDGTEPHADSPVYNKPKFTEHATLRAFTKQTWGAQPVSPTQTLEVIVAENIDHRIDDGFIYRVYHASGNENTSLPIPSTVGLVPMLQEVHQWSPEMRPKVEGVITEVAAYLAITEADTYAISLETQGEIVSELYFNDMETPVEAGSEVYLEKGAYPLLIRTISGQAGSSFALRWKNSNRDEIVPAGRLFFNSDEKKALDLLVDFDNDQLTDKEEDAAGSNPRLVDSDGDGLSDYDELKVYFTNPTNSDSDGDDLSDDHEIFVTGTNPNAFDSDGDGLNDYIETLSDGGFTEVLRVPGSSFVESLGTWEKDGDTAKSKDYNGTVVYDVTLPADDKLFLHVVGGGSRSSDIGELYNLSVFVDGEHINTLNITDDEPVADDNFGMSFESAFTVTTAGDHSFALASDGGSQLFVNGNLVVDNDGLHELTEATGNVILEAGSHTIKVIYFEQASNDQLTVSFAEPGGAFQIMDQSHLDVQTQWWSYEGTWETLPNFVELSPTRSGYSNGFDLESRKAQKRKTWYLPYLKAGNHTITVRWNNGLHNRKLRIDELIFSTLEDQDLDGNGLKDWVDVFLAKDCTVADVTSSITSPVCLEGQGKYTTMMNFSDGSVPVTSIDDSWYANVPLNTEGKTKIEVSFQSGAKVEHRKIRWATTRMNKVNSLTIRAGDSLLLAPGGKKTVGTSTITFGDQVFKLKMGEKLPLKFDTPGTYTLTSEYRVLRKKFKAKSKKVKDLKQLVSYGAKQKTASLEVTVIGLDLPEQPFPSYVGRTATRDLFGSLPEGVTYTPDSRIAQWEDNNNVFKSYIVDNIIPRKVVTRLGEDGPILDDITLQGIALSGMGQTTYYISETFEDGTYVSNLVLVANPVPPGAEITLWIFVPGATFIDGSTFLVLTADDFDELGHCLIQMVKDPSVSKTSNCHRVALQHNGLFVHRR